MAQGDTSARQPQAADLLRDLRGRLSPQGRQFLDEVIVKAQQQSPEALLAQASAAMGLSPAEIQQILQDPARLPGLVQALLDGAGSDTAALREALARAGVPLPPPGKGAG